MRTHGTTRKNATSADDGGDSPVGGPAKSRAILVCDCPLRYSETGNGAGRASGIQRALERVAYGHWVIDRPNPKQGNGRRPARIEDKKSRRRSCQAEKEPGNPSQETVSMAAKNALPFCRRIPNSANGLHREGRSRSGWPAASG